MKRNMIILVSVLLAVTLAVGGSIAMANPNGTDIDKELSENEASLGDHITVTLNVIDGVAGQTVVDTLPDPLKYINGTLNVTGGNATCVTSEGEISCMLAENATYTITFDVQVTSTEAGNITVTNNATVANLTASAELLITPYDGFEKGVEIVYEGTTVDGNVSVGELVAWNMTITVPNNFAWNITSAVLSDNLGGELGMADDDVDNDRDASVDEGDWGDLAGSWNTIPDGTLDIRTPGKSNKVHFKITGINVTAGDSLDFVLGVFTDKNPAKKNSGKQCYTSDGTYDLNSGAVLKFTDPETGFQLSAHTPPITVEVFVPVG